MFHQYCVTFILALSLVAAQGSLACEGESCFGVSDCACGEVCVDVTDNTVCNSSSCTCMAGCAVGGIFIQPGVRRPRTYCNLCYCPSSKTDTIPRCTRVRWCDLPDNRPLYQVNPACHEQEQSNNI